MPRKRRRKRLPMLPKRRRTGFSLYGVGAQDPRADPNAGDRAHVRQVLAGFDELRGLPDAVLERLIEDLVAAVYHARAGVNVGLRYKSDKAFGRHVFMKGFRGAWVRARLRVRRWEHHDEFGSGESLYYRVAHALAAAFALYLPRDLGPLVKQAKRVRFRMSPAMAAAQLEEQVAQGRRRLDWLVLRLQAAQDAELAARRQRLAVLAFRQQAAQRISLSLFRLSLLVHTTVRQAAPFA
jgi:hypothetical protein